MKQKITKSKTKERISEYNREYVKRKLKENPNWFIERNERLKNSRKEWRKRNKEYLKKKAEEYRKRYPKKIKVRSLANRKIDIPDNQICQDCEKEMSTERHHLNYSFPLIVKFLCTNCHAKLNRRR